MIDHNKNLMKEYLHSTLIKYKDFELYQISLLKLYLHSTLIKYKDGSVLKNVESVKFTFHSD